jgi:hypothetical protein
MRSVMLALLVCVSPAFAQMPAPIAPAPEHALLKSMAGTWQVDMTMYQPDGTSMKSVGTMVARLTMDGLGLAFDHESPMGPGKMLGHGFQTWIPGKGKFQTMWMDNMSHHGMSLGWATWDAGSKTMTETITGPGPDGAEMTFTITTKVESEKKHVATFTMKGPDGKDMPMMEMVYTRKG